MYARKLTPAFLLFALAGGCASMEGQWSLADVEPTAARKDFAIENMTLQKDGTFYAESREMGVTKSVSGTWTYNDGVLSLLEEDGERHTYDAELYDAGTELELARHWEGRRVTAKFDKKRS